MFVYIVASSRVVSFSDPDLDLTLTGLIDQWFLKQTPGSLLGHLANDSSLGSQPGLDHITPVLQGIPEKQGRPGAPRPCLLHKLVCCHPGSFEGPGVGQGV